MVLPDVNLLIYAHNPHALRHQRALIWWNQCLQGHEGVALAWVVILGFVRIATHRNVFARPMTVEGATGRVEEWLALPHMHLVHPAQTHFESWSSYTSHPM